MSSITLFSAAAEEFNRIVADRHTMFDMGYSPIPVLAAEKKPLIRSWPTLELSHPMIELMSTIPFIQDGRPLPDHRSTGLRTTTSLVALDIDLYDRFHTGCLIDLVSETIGWTPLRRLGSKGALLCYRNTGEPLKKLYLKEDKQAVAEGEKPRGFVEFFGHGQFVAFGTHPTAGQPYRWVYGDSPLDVPLAELPPVSPEQIVELRGVMRARLIEQGYAVKPDVPPPPPTRGAPPRVDGDDDLTEMFLALVPATRPNHRGWINLRCPACRRRHNDEKAGFIRLPGGGFKFSCFRAACEYSDPTGWTPGGFIGPRVRELYSLLGGNPDDLPRKKRPQMLGVMSLRELLEDYDNHIGETN
jgi:hypothetical protein